MEYLPAFKYYLIDPATGNYYTVQQDSATGDYIIDLSTEETPLPETPDGWNDLEITWKRHRDYFGNFRSYSGNFKFSNKSWGILNSLFRATNSQAQCILRIDEWEEAYESSIKVWRYTTIYKCYLDFSRYNSDDFNQIATIGTIDSGLYSKMELNAGNEFALRYWDSTGGETWETDGVACYDEGISLLFNARYTDGSKVGDTVSYTVLTDPAKWTTPTMVNVQLVPYIGNVILANLLEIGSQTLQDGVSTWDNYTTDNYSLHSLLSTTVLFLKPILSLKGVIRYANPPAAQQMILHVNIAEVDNTNTLISEYNFFDIAIDHNGSFPAGTTLTTGEFNIVENRIATTPALVTITQMSFTFNLQYDKIYTLIYRGEDTSGATLFGMFPTFSTNEFYVTSKRITGLPDTDLRFPASPYIGFRPATVLEKLVPLLSSNETDAAGFPIVASDNAFVGRSDYLSDPTVTLADNYDNIPYNTLFTSGNAVRLTPGQQYLNMSLDKFFQICFSVWGLGMAIENDDSGEPNVIRVEPLTYFFDKDTELFDLGYDITSPEFMPLTEYICGEITAGYTAKWQDFSEYIGNNVQFFGVDAFNIFQSYRPPFTQGAKNVLDMVAPVVAEPSKKEADRSRQQSASTDPDVDAAASSNTAPVTTNTGNDTYLMELEATATVADTNMLNPSGYGEVFTAYKPLTYPTADITDPTTPPYVRGLNFPKAMQNLGITPAKNMLRNGKLLHSITDGQEGRNIAFQKQYWNLYNGNLSVTLGGIATNLNAGLVTEVADIAVSDLPDKLFKPILIRFTTRQPLNMYSIISTNNRGYVTARMKKKYGFDEVEIKGFLFDVKQNFGTDAATTFTLLMHPDMEY